MKSENLIGKIYGQLTVISKANNIIGKTRNYVAWNCLCSCGKILIIRSGSLKRQKSCGCALTQNGLKLKAGQKFHKLTTVSYEEGYWNCLCDCGGKTYVSTNNIISGNTKSCGCLREEKSKENIQKAVQAVTKYHPRITTARRKWKSYCYADKQCDLKFEEFYEISQKNCTYCGIQPNTRYNFFLKKKDASQYTRDNGFFVYNGLDRVDSKLPHLKSNVVSCCPTCNRAKSDRDLNEFHLYLDNLKTSFEREEKEMVSVPVEKYKIASINESYRHYADNYPGFELTLKEFYNYSQLECYYCGIKNSNHINIYKNDKTATMAMKAGGDHYYNGIDRLDNSKGHERSNVVSCCKYCNFAKNSLNLDEFKSWILRIKAFRNEH